MTLDSTTLLQTIQEAAEGLLFPSESDFPIEPFTYGTEEPSPATLLERRGLASDAQVEEVTFASIFEGLTDVEDDASDDAKASADRFLKLMNVLEENLQELRVYRLGQTEIEVIALGRDASGTWQGVRTNVVET